MINGLSLKTVLTDYFKNETDLVKNIDRNITMSKEYKLIKYVL